MIKFKKVKLEQLCTVSKGKTGIAKAIPGKYPLVTTGQNLKTCNEYHFECKAVCIPLVSSTGHGKKTLNNVHYQEGKFALGTILAAVIPRDKNILDAKYLHLYLSFYKDEILVPLMKGAANVSLSIKDIKKINIEVPSIGTQKSIVKRYNLIRRIQAKLLKKLDNQSILAEKLRNAILQEAIEGKLTASWRKQHPELINGENSAEDLLKKIKKQKTLPPIAEKEKPFELPESWAWCRLNDVSDNIHYGFTASAMPNVKEPKLLRITDIQNDKVNWINVPGCKIETNEIKKYLLSEGDILVARTGGTIGKSFQIDNLQYEAIFASYLIRIIVNNLLNKKYIKYFMQSRLYWIQLDKMSWGSGQPNVNATNLKKMIFPLPPFDEQELIINRIGNLMDIIDNLEKNIDHQKKMSDQLTQSLLREAFEQNI
jgi:type I restriction enzyme, S subunit